MPLPPRSRRRHGELDPAVRRRRRRLTGAGIAIDPIRLQRAGRAGPAAGTITPNQSVDLTQQTTLRAGDSFQIQIQGMAPRTATITIDPGETYNSLVTKINAQLGQTGTAAVNYTGSAEDMTITANPGNTINLIAGPGRFRRAGAAGHRLGRHQRAGRQRHQQHDHKHQCHQRHVIDRRQADLRPGPDRRRRWARWTFPPRRART